MSITKTVLSSLLSRLPLVLAILLYSTALASANPVTYKAGNPSKGKKIVFVASDHEYRAEETLPALARILAVHHGFDCTVLFGLNGNGEIEAGASNIPGLEALEDADGMVIFTRFLALPVEQMKHIDDYLNRAGPVVGLRTSTHGFKYDDKRKNDPYYKYSFRYTGEDYQGGFGHQVLGQSWVGHYGRNHKQSTRIDIIPAMKNHPILKGVSKVHVHAGGYNAKAQKDWNILTMAQPLMTMEANGVPDPDKPPMASEWTRQYEGKNGKKGRVFTSLYGASEDILNPGYRRLIINGIYWSLGLEKQIKENSNIDFVGPYKPNTFRGGGEAKGIKPKMYADLKSPIPANHNTERITPRKRKISLPDGRFLRIELPGMDRILTLNEVEIYSNGRNVAKGSRTKQSSVAYNGISERAVDGNTNPDYGGDGQTHTKNSIDPWWEVDLGKNYPIEKIEVWNRDGGTANRLHGFKLELLDGNRKPVFIKSEIRHGQRIVFDLKKGGEVSYLSFAGKVDKLSYVGNPVEVVGVPDGFRDPTPFVFQKGDVVAILGNGLADRMQPVSYTHLTLPTTPYV